MSLWKLFGRLGFPQVLIESLPEHSVPAGEREEGQNVVEQKSYLYRGSLIHTIASVVFLFGVCTILYQFGAIAVYEHIHLGASLVSGWFWESVLKGLAMVLSALFWMAIFHPYVDMDTLGVLQFIGTSFYTRCRPFLIPWRRVARLILIPGGPQFESTPDVQTEEFAVFSQVKQLRRGIEELEEYREPDDPEDAPPKKRQIIYSDRQFFKLDIVYRLDIFRHPERVTKNFLQFFVYDFVHNEHKFTAMKRDVLRRILGIIAGRTDEVLSKLFMEQMIQDNGDVLHTSQSTDERRKITAVNAMGVEDVNLLLFKHLSKVLADIGVELMQITISEIMDTHDNGYIGFLRRRAIAKQQAETEKTEARARADARQIEAEQEQLARIREAEVRLQIALKDAETAAAEVDVAKQTALRDAQPLLLLLKRMQTDKGQKAALMANFTQLVASNPDVIKALFTALGYNNNNVIVKVGGLEQVVERFRTLASSLLPNDGILPPAEATPVSTTT